MFLRGLQAGEVVTDEDRAILSQLCRISVGQRLPSNWPGTDLVTQALARAVLQLEKRVKELEA